MRKSLRLVEVDQYKIMVEILLATGCLMGAQDDESRMGLGQEVWMRLLAENHGVPTCSNLSIGARGEDLETNELSLHFSLADRRGRQEVCPTMGQSPSDEDRTNHRKNHQRLPGNDERRLMMRCWTHEAEGNRQQKEA